MLKELSAEIQAIISTFIAFIGFIVWAWVGRIVSRYSQAVDSQEKMPWSVLLGELPIAIGMGIILGGASEYLAAQEIIRSDGMVQSAFVAAGAYLGPRLFEDAWRRWVSKGRSNTNVNVTVNNEHNEERKDETR